MAKPEVICYSKDDAEVFDWVSGGTPRRTAASPRPRQAFNEAQGKKMYGAGNFVIVDNMATSVLAISKLVWDAVLRDTL